MTIWSATQVPHILRFLIAATTGIPESKVRVIAPDVGGGFGGKLQTTPEEFATLAVARRLGKPCKYTETRSETMVSGHHGRDQWQKLTLAADEGRHGHRPEGRAARRPRRLRRRSSAAACRCSARGCSTRSTSSRPTSSTARRCSPTRPGSTPTEARADPRPPTPSSGSWTSSPPRWGRPARDPREELDHPRGVPLHHRGRDDLRLGQLRGGHGQGHRALRLRRAARRAAAPPRAATTRCSSASASRRSPRCAAWPPRGSSASLNYGAGGWEHATIRMLADRQGRGAHRARRRTARATRRPGARSSPTGSACRSRTSRCCTATPRSRPRAWTPTARGRSSSVVRHWSRRPTRSSRRPSRSRRTCSRPASTTSSSRPAGSASRAPTRASAIAEVALADLDRPQPARRRGADARRRRDLRPGATSPSRTAPTCARWRSTPRPAPTTMRKYVCVDDIGDDHQPADRRGPGARRPRPGHRAGAVGGGGVRRPRHPGHRLVRRLHPSRPRPTRSASSPTTPTSPSTTNTLGTKGVGEAGTIASTPAVVNAIVDAVRPLGVNDILMPCTPERVWKAIQAGRRRSGDATR